MRRGRGPRARLGGGATAVALLAAGLLLCAHARPAARGASAPLPDKFDRRPMTGRAKGAKAGGRPEPVPGHLANPDAPVLGKNSASMEDLVLPWGYPLETYPVETPDGFILRPYRIPYGVKNATDPAAKRPAVLLLHGITLASSCFVVLDPDSSMGFYLADAGFDVWMANMRANTHSRGHRYYRDTQQGYWEHSMDELALIDLPAQIDFIRNLTGQDQVALIGHSQGCTLPLMLMAARPEYNQRSWLLMLLGAVTKPDLIQAKNLANHAKNGSPLVLLDVGIGLLISNSVTAQMVKGCNQPIKTKWCYDLFSFMFYGDSKFMDWHDFHKVASTWPATVALRNLLHWSQLWHSADGLDMYDFGTNCSKQEPGPAPFKESCNQAKYGQAEPPEYELDRVTATAAIFEGDFDVMATKAEVERLRKAWSAKLVYDRMFHDLAHMDFVWARDPIVKPDILRLLWNHAPWAAAPP